jgi:quercetin dioxygenase-like cupin family protein
MRQRITRGVVVAVLLGAAFYAGSLTATPASGFSATTLATARFDELKLKNKDVQRDWESEFQTEGLSDLYVQSNVWAPVGDATFPAGGSTGWHTHPGFSLIIVTAGTVTAYEGDDPSCTPHVYTKGMGFVDPGGGHVHLIRNEGAVEARTIAVQLVPAAATRRIDAPAPGNCAF